MLSFPAMSLRTPHGRALAALALAAALLGAAPGPARAAEQAVAGTPDLAPASRPSSRFT